MPVSGGPVTDFASKFMRALDVDATMGGPINVPSGRVTGLVLANFAAPVWAGFAAHSTYVACGERGSTPGGFRRTLVLLELRFAIQWPPELLGEIDIGVGLPVARGFTTHDFSLAAGLAVHSMRFGLPVDLSGYRCLEQRLAA